MKFALIALLLVGCTGAEEENLAIRYVSFVAPKAVCKGMSTNGMPHTALCRLADTTSWCEGWTLSPPTCRAVFKAESEKKAEVPAEAPLAK